jgi:hypothetical protein
MYHMSFTEQLVLWLHIGFVIFTIGPVSVAIMTTPRYIRGRNLIVLRYLYRTTRIFTLISLGVLIFGIVLGQQLGILAKPWLTAAMTLFVVAIVLLIIIIRDQRKAISALEVAEAAETAAAQAVAPHATVAVTDSSNEAMDDAHAAGQPEPVTPGNAGTARHIATVERGRIATMGAVVSVIWLVILVLMVWGPTWSK